MQAKRSDLRVSRKLHEDDDFVILEVGKRDDVTHRIEDGDQFYTILFVHQVDGNVEVWDPFNEGS
jgi:hypothetical protein